VGEAHPFDIAVLGGREEGSGEQRKAVRVLVMSAEGGTDQLFEGAADPRQIVLPFEPVPVRSLNSQRDVLIPEGLEVESAVEQANEGSDRTGRVVVLGHAEEQGAASLHVAQVHVVAQRRSADAAS